MLRMSQNEFETVSWLLTQERYNQCVNSIALKCFDNKCLHYLNEVFIKGTRV